MKLRELALWMAIPAVFAGCTDLGHIGGYAAAANNVFGKYEEIPCTFSGQCRIQCLFRSETSFQINRKYDCGCSSYARADSVTQLIAVRLSAYYQSLGQLADSKKTSVDFGPVKEAMAGGSFGQTDANGTFHGIRMDTKDAGAILSLSELLSNAYILHYRKRQLAGIVDQANAPVQLLLARLKFILMTNLQMELEFHKESLYSFYRGMMLGGKLTEYEKDQLFRQYTGQLSALETQQQQLRIFGAALDTVAHTHQLLYDRRSMLTSKELRTTLVRNATSLNALLSSFHKLQNQSVWKP